MMSSRMARGVAFTAGTASLIAMGVLTAGCSSTATDKQSPTSESTTPATMSETMSESMSPSPSASPSPSVAPTEKAVTPGGANSFTPSVNPVGPNAVCNKIVNGVCVR